MGRPGHQDPRLIMTKVTARVLQSAVPCGDELRRSRSTGFSSLDEPLTGGELAVRNRMRQQLICAMLARPRSDHRATIERAALAALHTTAADTRRMCAEDRNILGGNGIPQELSTSRRVAQHGV
jgi:hypothetical protein